MSKKVKMHKNFLFYSFRHACGVPPSPTAGETLSPKVTEGVVQNDEQFKICSFIVLKIKVESGIIVNVVI